MIPEFVDDLNLENKAHRCTIEEVRARFCSEERMKLCDKLEHLLHKGRECGFLYALIGGSFATAKPLPQDLDITWFVPHGVDKTNVSCDCADMMDSQHSRERFGADFLYVPLKEDRASWPEDLERWGRDLGFDPKTNTERGTLLLELI